MSQLINSNWRLIEWRKFFQKTLILAFEVIVQYIIYCTIFPFISHYGIVVLYYEIIILKSQKFVCYFIICFFFCIFSRNCENMTFLDLSHNYIYGMTPTVFGDNSYATELRLDYNYLTTMAGVPLDNQVGIRMLNVSHNQVSVLKYNQEGAF